MRVYDAISGLTKLTDSRGLVTQYRCDSFNRSLEDEPTSGEGRKRSGMAPAPIEDR